MGLKQITFVYKSCDFPSDLRIAATVWYLHRILKEYPGAMFSTC